MGRPFVTDRSYRIPDGKPPRFPKKPTIRQEGDVLIMECILEAHPVPEITWYQGSKVIADSSRIKMFRKSTGRDTYLLTLEISNPTKADGGNYRCNAFNNFGESNANISLNFQGKSEELTLLTWVPILDDINDGFPCCMVMMRRQDDAMVSKVEL